MFSIFRKLITPWTIPANHWERSARNEGTWPPLKTMTLCEFIFWLKQQQRWLLLACSCSDAAMKGEFLTFASDCADQIQKLDLVPTERTCRRKTFADPLA